MKEKFAIVLIILLCTCSRSVAQLCQGSLGDPIVNITFGSGPNPGAPLAAATTGYTYYSPDCPNDGFYSVRNSTNSCYGGSWHSLSRDHTGNTDGYFMLVNASLQPDFFYIDTVRGLCSNTTFEFAAWILNILTTPSCDGNGIQPNLTFTIERTDGTSLQTYNTGFIPGQSSPQWKQFGFFFTTPAGVQDVVLKIFNNSRGGCGNDLALDDITFRPCGPQINTSIDGYSTDSIVFCDPTAAAFTLRSVFSTGFAVPQYQWQQSRDAINWTDIAGAAATSYSFSLGATVTGKYYFRMAAAEQSSFGSVQCRVVSPVITIVKGLPPVATVAVQSPVCEGTPVGFTASGGTAYRWFNRSGTIDNSNAVFTLPSANAGVAGKVYVNVTGSDGCVATDSVALQVLLHPASAVRFDTATICEGGSVRLEAFGGSGYSWQPAASLSAANIPDPLASPAVSTSYFVQLTATNGCAYTDTVRVNVIGPMVADAGADKVIIKGDAVQLRNSTPVGTYAWSPATSLNNSTVKEPMASPPQDIDYVLTATAIGGCSTDMDTVHITVLLDIFVPNAFSPDGNGINDTWEIPALKAFNDFDVSVYNRVGQQVYHCANVFIPWDGSFKGNPLDPGTYVYLVRIHTGSRRVLKGSLVLLR